MGMFQPKARAGEKVRYTAIVSQYLFVSQSHVSASLILHLTKLLVSNLAAWLLGFFLWIFFVALISISLQVAFLADGGSCRSGNVQGADCGCCQLPRFEPRQAGRNDRA
jgi:hypothetical protein